MTGTWSAGAQGVAAGDVLTFSSSAVAGRSWALSAGITCDHSDSVKPAPHSPRISSSAGNTNGFGITSVPQAFLDGLKTSEGCCPTACFGEEPIKACMLTSRGTRGGELGLLG